MTKILKDKGKQLQTHEHRNHLNQRYEKSDHFKIQKLFESSYLHFSLPS
jgi:hypothetical protein